MRHVISVTVENKPGVLAHISSLFAARGYSIDSLAVGETEDPNVSRMTIVTRGDDQIIEQITKQLRKLISTLKVQDLGDADFIERDLVLIKVGVASGKRSEILEVVDIFRGKIVDVAAKDVVIELSGQENKIQALVDLLRPYGIKEMARTGSIAMTRGAKS
ncbi:MAG TPA: acetolactate synthase small subunit [Planctomycetota bacterium]|nr:acetolactate synthase small subunit [Planctomycetota bacterium]HUW32792.1 acetolactate synthase small subunit [Planctomycetota bacterium]